MPSLPLDPRPDRAPDDAAPAPASADAAPAPSAADPLDPETETEAERARRRDRRTGVIALVAVTIVLWAVIAAAVGFVTTM
jgi:hypothetical protein